ncbi:MAG: peptide deformylase [Candidatus Omnitrophica bacterium]|nr:peptide deformylase [Candidatus Omnitrophota bacterium]
MWILQIARLGHPVLRHPAAPVTADELASPEIQKLIDGMILTMRECAGVGLAANQIHVSKQIAVIESKKNPRYPDAPDIPLTVLINPRLTSLSVKKEVSWEGCLSIPDLRGAVPRAESLVCEGLDRQGRPLLIEAKGFKARVIQHECDHLAGKVYLDRMEDFSTLTHLAEFGRFWNK